jgi:hypothetical protein
MSIWEFRQWIESAIPWWAPFVIAALVLFFASAISAGRSSRLARWLQRNRVENRIRAVIEWKAHYYGCDLTDAEIERFIYDDNLAFKDRP